MAQERKANSKLKVKCVGDYPKFDPQTRKTTDVFIYEVIGGTKADLQRFEDAQGEYYQTSKETDNPLWFSSTYFGDFGTIIVYWSDAGQEDRITADQSALRRQRALVKNAGGDFGQAMAQLAAAQFLGVSQAPVAQNSTPSNTEEELSEDELEAMRAMDEDANLSNEEDKKAGKKK